MDIVDKDPVCGMMGIHEARPDGRGRNGLAACTGGLSAFWRIPRCLAWKSHLMNKGIPIDRARLTLESDRLGPFGFA